MKNKYRLLVIIAILGLLVISLPFILIDKTEFFYRSDSKFGVKNDAILIEEGAVNYCELNECSFNQELTWNDLRTVVYLEEYHMYEFYDDDDDVIARYDKGNWHVYIERKGTGELEYEFGKVPSICGLDCVIEDKN